MLANVSTLTVRNISNKIFIDTGNNSATELNNQKLMWKNFHNTVSQCNTYFP